jgi:uncharacterized membrane protein YeaQ/YmgE (transglycosylase-associated protein family)
MTFMYYLAYATIGLFIGWLSRIITKERGVKMIPSLAFGVLGALAGTFIVQVVGLAGTAFYAAVGSVGVLFTLNVFRQKEPIFSDTETL